MGTKNQDKKKQKFDSLLKSAFRQFTEKGFSKTTIADIAKDAGVAKGTFYLYFKDKYDLRSMLIQHEATKLFENAYTELEAREQDRMRKEKEQYKRISAEDAVSFMMFHALDELASNPRLLIFLNKNLSWGIFKNVVLDPKEESEQDFQKRFRDILLETEAEYKNPDIALFMIVELVGSAGYSAIMYEDPVNLEELKPYLSRQIHNIMEDMKIK
ncbi:MAG: TetR/AcrR family transcriptional regulator [Lachnospiraceae bacterium]|nr:TetR/AcrR family transcriptional regulator [Lachnospiraceae bacterium]